MSTIPSFVREVVKRMQGNTDAAIAERNFRKASSGLNIQISGIKNEIVEQEEVVADAKEALNEAKFPTEKINETSTYLENIRDKYENLVEEQDKLADLQESLKFYQTLETDFEKMVENA